MVFYKIIRNNFRMFANKTNITKHFKTMKKSVFSTLAFIFALFVVTSCTTKQGAINKLERFSYELRDNGRYYSFRDWEDAAERFSDIRKTVNFRGNVQVMYMRV